jgi:hypothetical protein
VAQNLVAQLAFAVLFVAQAVAPAKALPKHTPRTQIIAPNGLLQTPTGLAFLRLGQDGLGPGPAWTVDARKGNRWVPLGVTWGAPTISDFDGTGKGPGFGVFEEAFLPREHTGGEWIPLLFDLRGLKPGQRIRLKDEDLQFQGVVAPGTDNFSTPTVFGLCEDDDLLLGSKVFRLPGMKRIKGIKKCSDIPRGSFVVKDGSSVLNYVYR